MTKKEIREPIQKRSIEKKDKIIKKGFDLICEKGYYNTNTAEIAKAAGVSTGIVYNYFKDKHDIFIAGLQIYSDNIFYPMIKISEKNIHNTNLEEIIEKMIDNFIKNHKMSISAHEEITAMIHSDKDVAYFFHKREMDMTLAITNLLIENGMNSTSLMEKVHVAIGLVDNMCHEIVYHKHKNLDYDAMKKIVVNIVVNLIK